MLSEPQALKLRHGEYAVKLRVKKPVRCQECKRELGKGEPFWLDHIPYKFPRGKKTHYKRVICEACWRGPHNIWRRKPLKFWRGSR